VLVIGVGQVSLGAIVGLDAANSDGNVPGLAQLLFSKYVFAFEATSALLITAALGAMVLAHRERLTPKQTQADLAARRMRSYAEQGTQLGPLPAPGCLRPPQRGRHPGAAARRHRRRVLGVAGARARGTVRSAPAMADDVARSSAARGRPRPATSGAPERLPRDEEETA
jgi:NADH-quinone oxidoreductase subunit J